MKKLVLVIMTQKSGPRMNATSAKQSRGPTRWFIVEGNIPVNSVGMNKHYRSIGQGGVLKYIRRKLLPSH